MRDELVTELKGELQVNQNIEEIRTKLISKGYLDNDVDEAITIASKDILSQKKIPKSRDAAKSILKSFLDRIGFGFGSPQYINILFQQIGASLFLVGIINGIKTIISALISSYVREHQKQKNIKGTSIGFSEILISLSFILFIVAYLKHSLPLFILGMILLGIFFAYYNDAFNMRFKLTLKENKKEQFTGKITHLGLILTGICLFLSAYIMDKFPSAGYSMQFSLFEKEYVFSIYGYTIAFGIAALFFIISGLMIINSKTPENQKKVSIGETVKNCLSNYRNNLSVLFKNKIILVLIITGTITGFVQTLGNSYYGIFIFNNFHSIGFGGFLNVAMIFIIAIAASIIAPLVTRKNAIEYGKFPMLLFGTMLMAIMPLSYYYKPNLISISMGTILGIIGGAITGVAQGLLTLDLINDYERKMYFESVNLFATIPLLITIPLGSYIAQVLGLKTLFLLLAILLACVVVPLYFIIIVSYNKKEKI